MFTFHVKLIIRKTSQTKNKCDFETSLPVFKRNEKSFCILSQIHERDPWKKNKRGAQAMLLYMMKLQF